MSKQLMWRWAFYLGGLPVLGLGIAMTIKGYKLGIGPWDVFHVGLYQQFGLTIGSWSIIMGLLIIIATTIAFKEWPKIGTWLNMILLGMFIDLFNWLLPDVEALSIQTVLFVVGILVISCGIGIYMSPNIGAGPRDSLMLVFVEKFGMSVKRVRTTIEVIVALLGWLLGGPVGVGTVVIALGIGQILQVTLPLFRKLLVKVAGEPNDDFLFKVK